MSKLEKVEKAIEKGKEAALIKLAQDKDEEVRLAAIAGMGKIGKDDSFNFIVPDMLTNDDPQGARHRRRGPGKHGQRTRQRPSPLLPGAGEGPHRYRCHEKCHCRSEQGRVSRPFLKSKRPVR